MATSAGILLYREGPTDPSETEVLLVHPGGPIWARRDLGAWSIPKGEVERGEEPLAAALREFAEELGSPAPAGEPAALGEVRLKSGKRVVAWALAGDLDTAAIVSSTFEMAWPPRSGAMQTFPEVDRAQWCGFDLAKQKLNPAQAAFVDRLADTLQPSREAAR
ncbi:MAG TPA: NUDIX domain-containing protein [Solirubrobacteraceae bacterium]|nr:NUDIX domain-containing protein [Solirubrobacteraceae bacterium]